MACIASGGSLPGQDGWSHLDEGITVDTDFGGLVLYLEAAGDRLRLAVRDDGT